MNEETELTWREINELKELIDSRMAELSEDAPARDGLRTIKNKLYDMQWQYALKLVGELTEKIADSISALLHGEV